MHFKIININGWIIRVDRCVDDKVYFKATFVDKKLPPLKGWGETLRESVVDLGQQNLETMHTLCKQEIEFMDSI